MKRIALALFSTFAIATAAHAVEYSAVQADRSRIAFGYQQMGVSMDGSFKKFSSALRFDPAAPEAAKASIEVELASIDTVSGNRAAFLPTSSAGGDRIEADWPRSVASTALG